MRPYSLTFRHDPANTNEFSVVLDGRWVLGEFLSFELAKLFFVALLNDPDLLKKTVEGAPE